ncbi:MAG: DUF5329 domain-containing protein [Pseudoxanthomonas sp.]|nr:DUF5329 domain-containing protein [Pseudoxanthomonas sp.]
MIKPLLTLALLALSGIASVQAPSATTAREIASLFAALEASGCEFNRNGAWYDAFKASEHLQRKYDYLVKKHAAGSAETFIALAASESSMTGQPYKVRCPGKEAVDSRAWFQNQLLEYRTAKGHP